MKLNQNCVRDILLYVEDHASYDTRISPNSIDLPYSSDEIVYCAEKLMEAGYLNGTTRNYVSSSVPQIMISSLTWEGHKFLDNTRDDGVWKETKNVVGKFSSVSLSLIGQVASQIITSMIQKQLGLP